jgi:replicative DNA helicase
LKEIDGHAFSRCPSLESIDVAADNPYFKSLDGVLYTKDDVTATEADCGNAGSCKVRLLQYPESKPEPEFKCFANYYGGFAFSSCNYLNEFTEQDTSTLSDTSDSVRQGDITAVFSGYKELDKLTGGFRPGSLTIIAGRHGMGKMDFALNIALHAAMAENASVLYFSLEYNCQRVKDTLISLEAGITKKERGYYPDDEISWRDMKSLCLSNNRLAKKNIRINDSYIKTVEDLKVKCKDFLSGQDVSQSIVIVDYLQLLGLSENRNKSRMNQISLITESLKQMSMDYGVPFIVTSYLSIKVAKREDKRPILSDFLGNTKFPEYSDLMLFLHRDSIHNDNNAGDLETELIVAKNHYGSTGTVKLLYHLDYGKFEEIG